MKSSLSSHLTPHEEAAVTAYVVQIQQDFAGQLRAVTLFGSKARGEADEESDIDLLVLVKEEMSSLRADLWRIAADIGLDYNLVLSVRVISQARWAEMARLRLPLYRTIVTEGIPLSLEPLSLENSE